MSKFLKNHRQLVLYVLFGILTTLVSLSACYLTLKIGVLFLHDENGQPTELLDVLGSTLQWVTGVTVAFFTNKKWVFTNAENGTRSTAKQFFIFSGSRVATYVLEAVVNLLAIAALERLGYKPFSILAIVIHLRVVAKAISSVLVVISNYLISKFIVFK
jgi:putative flippase GtrA